VGVERGAAKQRGDVQTAPRGRLDQVRQPLVVPARQQPAFSENGEAERRRGLIQRPHVDRMANQAGETVGRLQATVDGTLRAGERHGHVGVVALLAARERAVQVGEDDVAGSRQLRANGRAISSRVSSGKSNARRLNGR
jgi:hypothetical protein